MTLRTENERRKPFVFCIDYIKENGQFMTQKVFPFVCLAPRILNLSFRHYYLSENSF